MAATVVPSSSPAAAVTLSPSLMERPTVPGGLGLPATTPGPGAVVGGGGGELTAVSQPPPPPLRSPPVSVTSPTGGVGRPQNNQVSQVTLYGVPIVCLWIDGRERLCLAQISNTLLKDYSYNEIHNRRVALGITCVQCTPVQLEILRRAGAMPVSSRRCGMITKREAERLVKSFLEDMTPPKLPDDFAFDVSHGCGWGCRGSFLPARYNSSRAKCVKCYYCNMFFSPNKFIFHFHRMPESKYNHPDAANFNSWRRHLCLTGGPSCTDDLIHAWEDVKAMFNGGSRKRVMAASVQSFTKSQDQSHAKRVKAQHAESQSRAESSMALTSKLQHAFHQRFPHAATAGGPSYPFPLFPHANKPMPPVAAKAFPMFATAQHLHMSATSPTRGEGRPQAGSAILPTAAARQMSPFPQHIAQETIYPSYEMIWAKHLGLSMYNENGFPPPHPRCLLDTSASTKRDERVSPPGGGDTEASKTGSGESRSRVRDGASSKGLIHGQFSAFKPVAAVTNNNLFKPYELDDDRGDRERDLCHNNECELLSDSCGDDESEPDNIDVDTVEEEERKNVSKEHEQCRQHSRDGSPDIATLSRDKTVGENVTAGGREASCSSPTAEFGVLCDSNDNCIEKGDSLSYTRPELSVVRSCGTGGGDLDQLAAAAGAKTEAVSQDQLENELMTAIETRKKLEEEFNIIKSTFEQRVHHECECREEMVRRFQEVRRRLSQELDQERRARSSLQHRGGGGGGGGTESQNAMATPHFNKMLDTGPSLLQ